jgi:tryptophan halogenase
VTDREDTPFWAYCKNMSVPDSLTERMTLFKTRGEAMPASTELFKETNWFAIMYNQGLIPEDYHPVADVISEDELKLRLSKIRTGIQDRVNSMTMHQQFIEQNCAAKAMPAA